RVVAAAEHGRQDRIGEPAAGRVGRRRADDGVVALGVERELVGDAVVLVEPAQAGEAAGDREAPLHRLERQRVGRADEPYRGGPAERRIGRVVAGDGEAVAAAVLLDL